MKTSDFDFDLPQELIAQTPILNRDQSRLLVLDKKTGDIEHHIFKDIVNYLNPGDVLVINDTKVIPARLMGVKEDTGAVIELLLLKDLGNDTWECLSRPQKRLHIGTIVKFSDELSAEVIELLDDGVTRVKLLYSGILPVYAKNIGSAAAPTAGLHFTKELLSELKDKGVIITNVTLHVGLGTFRPVEVDDINNHHMHSEYYNMSKETADILNKAKENGNKIIAVGTTSTRTLESVINKYGKFVECSGNTDIFIYPGYEFKAIDSLITNFHLPKSTLVMLVSALAGRENILNAYHEAINEKYRFFSFGDAMLIK